jgi:hypothetical protein
MIMKLESTHFQKEILAGEMRRWVERGGVTSIDS